MWLYKGTQSHYVALFIAVLLICLIFSLITSLSHPLDPAPSLSSTTSSRPAPFSVHSAIRPLITLTPTPFRYPSWNAEPPVFQRTNSSIQSAVLSHPLLHAHLHDTDVASHVDSTVEKALVLLFHGCSHRGMDWWELPEDRRIIRLLLAMGYSVIAFTSTDRSSGCWDATWPPSEMPGTLNADVGAVVSGLKAFLEAEYKADGSYPALFTMGASSGGVFTSLVSRALPIIAQVVIIAPGHEGGLLTVSQRPVTAGMSSDPSTLSAKALSTVDTLYPVPPTCFLYMRHDVQWASTPRIGSVTARMVEKGRQLGFRLTKSEAILLLDTEPVRLTRELLTERIDGLEREQSVQFYEEAVKDGFISSDGKLLQDPRESGIARYLVEKLAGSMWKEQYRAVEEEMNLLWGVHEMTSERMDEVVRWMERQRTGKAR